MRKICKTILVTIRANAACVKVSIVGIWKNERRRMSGHIFFRSWKDGPIIAPILRRKRRNIQLCQEKKWN